MEFSLQTGTFESTLDDKGRVVIPAPLRERYTEQLVIMQGKEMCVWVMTSAAYENLLAKFKKKCKENAVSSKEKAAFEYQHKSTAVPVEIDPKSGRIPISAHLRAYANLTKDCLVVSIDKRLEIWNADLNKNFMEEIRLINKELQEKVDFFSEEDEE